jgi:methionyl-tRNA formyltransferase
VRAFNPVPVAHTRLGGVALRIWRGAVSPYSSGGGAPGTILGADADGILVACGEGAYRILELQLEGRKRLDAAAVLNSRADLFAAGARFD